MSSQDEEFIKRLRAIFAVEAEEHLQTMSSKLFELERSAAPGETIAAIESIFREAHSLKGAARAVDQTGIESICQALEGIFSEWKKRPIKPFPETYDTLHHTLDAIRAILGAPEGKPAGLSQQQQADLMRRLAQLQRPASGAPQTDAPLAAAPGIAPHEMDSPSLPQRDAASETIRISSAKLDAHLLQTEDMLVLKSAASHRTAELRAFAPLFDQWRKEWAKISHEVRALRQSIEHGRVAGVPAGLLSFMEWNSDYLQGLERKVAATAKQAEQDRYIISRRVDDLLENSKKLLMQPFSTLAALFPKIVRDLCRQQEKEAVVTIHGGEIEVDKRILDEMKDALIHLVRNCVDHGIEKRSERELNKKPACAAVGVAVSQIEGGKIQILVSDDGSGVDVERVKASAVRHEIITQTEADRMSYEQALALIFQSDVSASAAVTSISGRGLGMAIARSKIEKLGGTITVESTRHAGTVFRMILPVSIATFRGVLVRCSDQIFVIPALNVVQVARVSSDAVELVENREMIALNERAISLSRLNTLLGVAAKPERGENTGLSVVVLASGDQHIAFAVDEVLHEEEVLVKPLRKPLVRVRNIAGATVLATGKAVVVLSAADLIHSARAQSGAYMPPAAAARAQEKGSGGKKLLVVEDSITSRMLLKGILESAGYKVQTAVDGVDAYTILREETFDLVVSDVEMPRLNGLDLTAKIRSDKRLSGLPVVLVTALESREERERGIDAGANAYVIKSSFDQSNLLGVIRRLL